MNKTTKLALIALLGAMTALYGCDEEGDPDAGVDSGTEEDSGTPPEDGGTDGGGGEVADCMAYCSTTTANCSGQSFWYGDSDDCMDICMGFGWPAGDPVTPSGPLDGNSIGCRTYHGGAPAGEMPDTHCPHASYTGGDVCGSWCENYCAAAMNVCTGDNAIYADMGECMTACTPLDATADVGVVAGDSVQCRMYHLSVAVLEEDPATHCPHASAGGGGVCTGGWTFRDDAPAAYTRVDHAGMPAVPTVLAATISQSGATGDPTILANVRNAYNDAAPATGDFVTPADGVAENLTALHFVLADDLAGMDPPLTPCATYTTAPALPTMAGEVDVSACLGQAGPLVIPDVIGVDRTGTIGFPNGRLLTDPVVDVTLAVILLDISTGDTPPHGATDLVGVNPTANDLEFSSDFPFLAAPHAPPAE
ncbi:MAG: DUF4331 family protein [Sandaracinaceae bacterium]